MLNTHTNFSWFLFQDPAYFAHTGVAFITICPGFTDTPLLDKVVEKTTFTYDTPSKHVIPRVKRQSPEICAQNLVKVIEEGSNGSIWLLDVGEMKQLEIPPMWRPQLEAWFAIFFIIVYGEYIYVIYSYDNQLLLFLVISV